jgi:hypothetical protein
VLAAYKNLLVRNQIINELNIMVQNQELWLKPVNDNYPKGDNNYEELRGTKFHISSIMGTYRGYVSHDDNFYLVNIISILGSYIKKQRRGLKSQVYFK